MTNTQKFIEILTLQSNIRYTEYEYQREMKNFTPDLHKLLILQDEMVDLQKQINDLKK